MTTVQESDLVSLKAELSEWIESGAAVHLVDRALAAIEALEQGMRELAQELGTTRDKLAISEGQREALERERDAKQARIDELMLEYCPDEMTPEQIEEWSRHQVRAALAAPVEMAVLTGPHPAEPLQPSDLGVLTPPAKG